MQGKLLIDPLSAGGKITVDPKLLDLMPFSHSRNRSAVILSYINRPPDDETGRKRRELNKMVMSYFVWATVLSLGVCMASGIAAAIIVEFLLSHVVNIAPPMVLVPEIGLAFGIAGWLWKAPQYFGQSLRELVNQIEWYAAEDGYYDQD